MADFDFHVNEGNMDEVLDKLSKGFSEKERWEINKPAADVFKKALAYHIEIGTHHHPYRDSKYARKQANRKSIIDALATNKEHGGAVKVGITRKSKKAYIARFLNDGWTPRNQHGGPYEPVAGEHFWENSIDSSDEAVKKAELEALRAVLKKRGL